MDDNSNAPVILFIVLTITVIAVIIVVLRMSLSRCLAKKRAQLANQQLQVTTARSTSAATEWRQSDHQIVFERMPRPKHLRNISTLNTNNSATQIVQEIAEQFRFDSLQMQYERQAQERRDALDRFNNFIHMPPRLEGANTGVTGASSEQLSEISLNRPVVESMEATSQNNFSYSSPAPRYISQDDGLPSYEAATATQNINR